MINVQIEKIKKWYNHRLGRIVLLCLIVVFFTTTVIYIPYFNILFGSSTGFLISFIVWYFLFSPSMKTLIFMCMFALVIAFVCTALKLNFLVEISGNILFVLMVFMLINYGRNLDENKKE